MILFLVSLALKTHSQPISECSMNKYHMYLKSKDSLLRTNISEDGEANVIITNRHHKCCSLLKFKLDTLDNLWWHFTVIPFPERDKIAMNVYIFNNCWGCVKDYEILNLTYKEGSFLINVNIDSAFRDSTLDISPSSWKAIETNDLPLDLQGIFVLPNGHPALRKYNNWKPQSKKINHKR